LNGDQQPVSGIFIISGVPPVHTRDLPPTGSGVILTLGSQSNTQNFIRIIGEALMHHKHAIFSYFALQKKKKFWKSCHGEDSLSSLSVLEFAEGCCPF
jgi:hypothetical protein